MEVLPEAKDAAPSLEFSKQAVASPLTTVWAPGGSGGDDACVKMVAEVLAKISSEREAAVLELAKKFDNWTKDTVIVSKQEIADATASLPDVWKEDVRYQNERVTRMAKAQLASLHGFEMELSPGCTVGQRIIPVGTAGCYVPGGRFSHVSSATMTIATAKAAGVKFVIAVSPPERNTGKVHPGTLYAMHIAGADVILALGGVQAIGALAYGCFSGKPADIIVGPGNKFVAEAKRQLFGMVGIDMFAGPTEVMVLADSSADAGLVAEDLVGQAEHGPTSPAWLITTDATLAKQVVDVEVPKFLAAMPDDTAARESWKKYGEVVVVSDRTQMAALSDVYAPEHLEVHSNDLDWWKENLSNYGSLFLGEETHTSLGDKTSGPNHVLPTKRVARYSGGLSVDKYVKKLTYQRCTREGVKEPSYRASRISRMEGMEGHARSCDARLRKYFPYEKFDLGKQHAVFLA
jgi:sulfopropanediol 3-dehydrogenase